MFRHCRIFSAADDVQHGVAGVTVFVVAGAVLGDVAHLHPVAVDAVAGLRTPDPRTGKPDPRSGQGESRCFTILSFLFCIPW